MARLLFAIIFVGVFCIHTVLRADEMPFSQQGNVTGGKCSSNSDCIQANLPGEPNRGVLCLTKAEANNTPVAPDKIPLGGLQCGCLPDVKHCGYAIPAVMNNAQ